MAEFRPILGFPHFLISDEGTIVSTLDGEFRVMPPSINWAGYNRIRLKSPDGKSLEFFVHRLVLETFVGPCPEGLLTRHLNGIKMDNRVSNLTWGTYQENTQDRIAHGTHHKFKVYLGSENPKAKLSESDVLYIRESKEKGVVLAKQFGVASTQITNIRKRLTWRHIP